MCKVMTQVMTLNTIAQHGHDSSHYPAKIQHAQNPEHVVMKPREICMNAHVEIDLDDMIMLNSPAEHYHVKCHCRN